MRQTRQHEQGTEITWLWDEVQVRYLWGYMPNGGALDLRLTVHYGIAQQPEAPVLPEDD